MKMKPIYEQRKLTAKFQCTKASKDRVVFEPIQRQYVCPGESAKTDLMDITINLNDEIRENLGDPKVGDVKDFTLEVTVMTGYEMQMDS